MSPLTILAVAGPGALTLLIIAAILALAPDAGWAAQAARGYPVLLLAGVALLAWRFRRSRLLAGAVALLVAHFALHDAYGTAHGAAQTFAAGLLPPLLLLCALMDDAALRTPRGLLQVGAPLLTAGAVAALLALDPERAGTIAAWSILDPWYSSALRLPQPALIAASLGVLGLAALAVVRRRPVEVGLAWCGIAGVLALAADAGSPARGLWLLGAGVALGVALVEASHALAYRDELTGLPARRALQDLLSGLKGTYTVAAVDVDRFKEFNDRYGHDVGDEVLRMVAVRLAAVGGGGRAFRSGGEEFTVVFPGRTRDEVRPFAERLREEIADSEFRIRKKPRPAPADGIRKRGRATSPRTRLSVTVSIGLAQLGGRNDSVESVVRSADEAMYRAKSGGRNRVAV